MSGRRLLVVEDERIVAHDIKECLERMDCEVVDLAMSGAEAVEKAHLHRPDLIMMDIVMQGEMDGIEAATVIRERYRIPSVFLTAYSDSSILDRAKGAIPAGFVVKPFEESTLRSTVEIALAKAGVERALTESNEWFGTTLLSIADGVVATTGTGTIKFMNPVAEQLTGWSSSLAADRPLDEVCPLFDEHTGQPMQNPALLALHSGQPSGATKSSTLVCRDRSTLAIDVSGSPIRDSREEVIGSVLILRDISDARHNQMQVREYQTHLEELVEERTAEIRTAHERLLGEVDVRRRAETALERRAAQQNLMAFISSEFLRLDVEQIQTGLCDALRRTGTLLGFAEAGLLSVESPESITLTAGWGAQSEQPAAISALPQSHLANWREYLAGRPEIYLQATDTIPEEAAWISEWFAAHKLGAVVAIHLAPQGQNAFLLLVVPASEPQSRLQHEDLATLNMLRTILASALRRQRAEEKNAYLQQQLVHSQKMEAVGKLSGGIAHDFNNMLLPILGYSDMLLDRLDPDSPDIQDVREIRKAAERAASLTRQLLAFSRKQVISKTVFNVNDAIISMKQMLQRIIGEDIDLITELSTEILPVRADKGQMEQIVMNLCVNARDAMPHGGAVRVRTGFTNAEEDANLRLLSNETPEGEFVYLRVTDSGCGMDEELVNHIFEPFYTTKGLDGTGLGLSVVYGIVEHHEGGIDVQSRPGKGTAITVYFHTETEEGVIEFSEKKKKSSSSSRRGNGEKILLVEDEPSVAKFVSHALRHNGYEVVCAMTAREATDCFASESDDFDMILSDAVLPDGNGVELLDEFLSTRPDIPALLSSGYSDRHSILGMVEERGIRFLQKPYSLPELIQTVGEVLEQQPPAKKVNEEGDSAEADDAPDAKDAKDASDKESALGELGDGRDTANADRGTKVDEASEISEADLPS